MTPITIPSHKIHIKFGEEWGLLRREGRRYILQRCLLFRWHSQKIRSLDPSNSVQFQKIHVLLDPGLSWVGADVLVLFSYEYYSRLRAEAAGFVVICHRFLFNLTWEVRETAGYGIFRIHWCRICQRAAESHEYEQWEPSHTELHGLGGGEAFLEQKL